eukprot:4625155-Pyramimonas_sp.AAC.1
MTQRCVIELSVFSHGATARIAQTGRAPRPRRGKRRVIDTAAKARKRKTINFLFSTQKMRILAFSKTNMRKSSSGLPFARGARPEDRRGPGVGAR